MDLPALQQGLRSLKSFAVRPADALRAHASPTRRWLPLHAYADLDEARAALAHQQ